MNRRTSRSKDRGATDPILVIAAIAVSLILLVSGSFAVAKLIANGKDLNAKDDLHKVAIAETALRAVATESGDGMPGTKWTGTGGASTSTYGTRTNYATNPVGARLAPEYYEFGLMSSSAFGYASAGTNTPITGVTDGPTDDIHGYMRKQWTTKADSVSQMFWLSNPKGVNGFPITPGEKLTISVWLRPNVTRGGGYIYLNGTKPGQASWVLNASTRVTAPANTWTRLSLSATVPSGVTSISNVSVNLAGAAVVGDYVDGTGLLVEKTDTVGDYFDGDTDPKAPSSKGYVPYLTDSTATALSSDLKPTGGAVTGTALANGDIRFTQSNGTRVAVLTDPAGSAWAAVSKSTTGSLFLRTSESSRVAALSGTAGVRTVPAGFPLPDTITAADINTALSNAGSF